jgi:hypothetical protein
MRTWLTHGPRRICRAARLALGTAAVLLTIGGLGAIWAIPAQAMNNGGPPNNNGGQPPVLQVPLRPFIVVQPTTTQVNEPVSPSVVVAVNTIYGQLATWYNGPVVLDYTVNPDSANQPTGNVAYAVGGIATFPSLTFSSVGFGFELVAIVTGGGSPVPWTRGRVTNSAAGASPPSAPFDIVDQLVQCQSGQSCQTETVASAGTSGSARSAAASGSSVLAATGGGFSKLSCTTFGGVLTFSSSARSQTIRLKLAGYLADHHPLWSFNVCWGAPQPFTTKDGQTSAFNAVNNDYEGLLPDCGGYGEGAPPCVLSRAWSWGGVVITVLAPSGDPHMTY